MKKKKDFFDSLQQYLRCRNCSHCKDPSKVHGGIFEEASCRQQCDLVKCKFKM